MTFCVGFMHDKGVFLAADSLISEDKNIKTEQLLGSTSSVGENLENIEKTLSESLVKVVKISDEVMATFAGDKVDVALERMMYIKEQIEIIGIDPEEAFKKALKNPNLDKANPDITVLFAYKKGGKPSLLSYNFEIGKREILSHNKGEILQIGSGCENLLLKEGSKKIIEGLDSKSNAPDILATVLAGLQSTSIRANTIEQSTGGFYYGGFLNEEDLKFMENTLYIFYGIDERKNPPLDVRNELSFHHLVKEEMSLVYSTHFEHKDGIFAYYLKDISEYNKIKKTPELMNKIAQLKEQYFKGDLVYIVSLNILHNEFVLCKKEDHQGYPFRTQNDDGNMEVGLPDKVIDEIVSLRKHNVNNLRVHRWI